MAGVITLSLVIYFLWLYGEICMQKISSYADNGNKLLLWTLLAPGVVIHESSHALAALLTGAGVEKFVPFKPVRTNDGWQFGYVIPKTSNHFQLGLTALAPLWLTPLLLYFSLTLIGPLDSSLLTNPFFYLWFYILISASLANMPSRPDFQAAKWFLITGLFCLIIIAGMYLKGIFAYDPTNMLLAFSLLLAPQAMIAFLLSKVLK